MRSPPAPAHSLLDDAQGLAFGAIMAAFGVTLLTSAGLVTGQTAGIAVLVSYLTGWGFGPVFFAINLPFYWFGYRRFGAGFVARTFLAVAAVSVLVPLIPRWLGFATLDPFFAALLYGFVTGAALLALFRHRASLGGIGILALWVQDRFGYRAGLVQLAVDALIFAAAFALRDPVSVIFSLIGALVLNLVIAINHRRDRYIGA